MFTPNIYNVLTFFSWWGPFFFWGPWAAAHTRPYVNLVLLISLIEIILYLISNVGTKIVYLKTKDYIFKKSQQFLKYSNHVEKKWDNTNFIFGYDEQDKLP